jgi:hypothetical protein
LLAQYQFGRHIGPENICPNIAAALERAKALFDNPPPIRCSA